jgi:hypothetical protein
MRLTIIPTTNLVVRIFALGLSAILLCGCVTLTTDTNSMNSLFYKNLTPSAIQIPGCAQTTARQLEPYRTLQKWMSFKDICKIVGGPDKDIGSGISVYLYSMEDGSNIIMGFTSLSDPVLYIRHGILSEKGEWELSESLLDNSK